MHERLSYYIQRNSVIHRLNPLNQNHFGIKHYPDHIFQSLVLDATALLFLVIVPLALPAKFPKNISRPRSA